MTNLSNGSPLATPTAPLAAEFSQLRNCMGWGDIDEQQAALCIERSLMCASAYCDEKLVAMGRIVGDGVLFYYLQDIIVHPDFRGRAYGDAVMR